LLQAIQALNKLTFCLEAIKKFSAANDPNLIGTIYVVASEILKEVLPEIEAIKANAMTAADTTALFDADARDTVLPISGGNQ
jgi:hypothetical protein